jgi:ABC-type transport system substrate-binding protein
VITGGRPPSKEEKSMHQRKAFLAAALLAVTVTATACGSSGGNAGSSSAAAPNGSGSAPASAAPSGGYTQLPPVPGAQPDPNARYGGTMNVAYAGNPKTFDPAVCYDSVCWNNMRMMFDRLYDYVGNTSDLAPEAAAALPTVSADGLTYDIKIRPNMKFSDGKPVRAQDFVYSFSRILDPATKSPVVSFWSGVQGAAEYAKKPTGTVSGITAVSDTELQIKLTAASSVFKYVLAMPHSSVIPEGSGPSQATKPVGSGPFTFGEYSAGQQIVLNRNTGYWDSPRPYVDKVVEKLGFDPQVQVLSVEKGDLDLMGDPIPPAQYLQITNDPSLKSQLVTITKPSTYFLAMNVKKAPFDNPKVREAVSYAIDRSFLIKLINGQGSVANEFLPPGIVGYSTDKVVHDQDIAKAKQLLSDAGFPNGLSVDLYSWNTPPFTQLDPQIQQDLGKAGITVNVKAETQSAFNEVASDPDKATLSLAFWVADFPDGSNFYGALLSCAAAIPGGQNYSFYCNKDVDDLVTKALASNDPAETAKLYQQAGAKMLADNPVVPLYYGSKTEIFGKQVGGYHSQPIWGWDMANYWKVDGSTTPPAK